jgi:hypothetical protein
MRSPARWLGMLRWAPAERAASTPEEREVRLSGYWHEWRASELKLHYFWRHPARTAVAVADTSALPRIDAVLGDGPSGRVLREHLTRRLRGLTLASSGACVLPVPAEPTSYSLGSHRQTLRRKVRAAERSGVTWRQVDDLGEQRELVTLLDRALAEKADDRYRRQGTDHSFMVGLGLWIVAEDAAGTPLLVSVTPHDGEWALLLCFITLGESDQHSTARYLLTKVVVEQLSTRGVRHLADTRAPSELTNGLRHFQRMVGFRITRVRVARAPVTGGSRPLHSRVTSRHVRSPQPRRPRTPESDSTTDRPARTTAGAR